jgi:hypothetical protein
LFCTNVSTHCHIFKLTGVSFGRRFLLYW